MACASCATCRSRCLCTAGIECGRTPGSIASLLGGVLLDFATHKDLFVHSHRERPPVRRASAGGGGRDGQRGRARRALAGLGGCWNGLMQRSRSGRLRALESQRQPNETAIWTQAKDNRRRQSSPDRRRGRAARAGRVGFARREEFPATDTGDHPELARRRGSRDRDRGQARRTRLFADLGRRRGAGGDRSRDRAGE